MLLINMLLHIYIYIATAKSCAKYYGGDFPGGSVAKILHSQIVGGGVCWVLSLVEELKIPPITTKTRAPQLEKPAL